MTGRVVSPEEREARARKAGRLAGALMPHIDALGPLTGPQAAEVVRLLPPEAKATIEQLAGVRRPASPHTWAVVAGLMRTRFEHEPCRQSTVVAGR